MRPTRRWRIVWIALAFLALASCGGGGSRSAPAPGSKLFIADSGRLAILSSIDPRPPAGVLLSIDRAVTGPSTGLAGLVGMALDAASDRMFALTGNVLVFDNISVANGNVLFSHEISAAVTTGGGLRLPVLAGLSLDVTDNVLYTVDTGGEVYVFNGASTANGLLSPNRTITPDLGASTVVKTFGIAIDTTRDMLYVGLALNGGGTSIIVFNNASSANTPATPLAPDRTLTFSKEIGSLYLDVPNNRLYAAEFDGVTLVFDGASALASGTPTPNRTITLIAAQNYIFVDTSRDKLFAVANDPAGGDSVFHIIDNVSTANDAVPMSVGGVSFNIASPNIVLSAVAVKP